MVARDIRGQRRIEEENESEHVVRRAARLAGTQEGVAARWQLRALGLSDDAIDRRIASGFLIVLFRGVYAVGHAAVSPRAWARAALLALGTDAVLSHRTAAFVWGLAEPPPAVHVTTSRRLKPRPGLVPHTMRLGPPDTARRDGMRVTTVLRTLHDLRHDPDIERLAAEAHVLGLATAERLARLRPDHAPTRSRFERAMRRLVARAGLPQPLVNHHVAGHECDFVWPEQRVIVETDGWGAHGHRRRFEDDRAKDQVLAAHGYVVLRVTWRQLTREPLRVAANLARVLTVRRAPAVPG